MSEIRPRFKKLPEGGSLIAALDPEQSYEQWEGKLALETGSGTTKAARRILLSYLPALGLSLDSPIDEINGAIDTLCAAKPQDPLECQIISQMLASGHHAMKLMAKAADNCSPEVQHQWLSLATRLMRVNTQQLEAIGRYRRKGEQRMYIERIDVNSGSQAVIGSINRA